MRAVLFVALAFGAAVLQSAVLRWVGGGRFPVAIPLAMVVYLGLHARDVEGAVAAAGCGYVVDLMTGGPKGLMTGLAVALFLFARLAGGAVDVRGRLGYAALTLVGVFLYGGAALGMIALVTPADVAPRAALLRRVGLEALLTALASPLVYGVLRRVDALFVREEPGLLR